MTTNWQAGNEHASEQDGLRTGDMWREYRRQNQHNGSPQNLPMQEFQGQPPIYQNQYSPVAPRYEQPQSPIQQYSPEAQGYIRQQSFDEPVQQVSYQPRVPYAPQTPPTAANNQGWASQAVKMVRQWSGKMVALNYGKPESPMVLRHPAQPQIPQTPTLPKTRRWKRSRTLRVAMQMRHRRYRWQSKSPNGGRIGAGILIAIVALFAVILSSSGAYAYGYYQSQLPRVQQLASQHIEQTSRMYDRNGVLLGDIFDPNGDGRRTPVQFKDIPKVMQDAMIAAEDKTFWTNTGVDPQGILRAGTAYLQHNSIQGGGSTLTQQLIKNMTGDTDLTLNRKLPEAALAIGLTEQYPKWKIMEMYFNVSPFGTLDLGVEAAAEEYFGLQRICNPKNFVCVPGISRIEYDKNGTLDPVLGLARASLLAGMPQSPVSYDPTNGTYARSLALIRQSEVLHNMLDIGMSVDGHPITLAMVNQAEALTAKMTFTRYKQNVKAPHFFYWVRDQLAIQLGNGDETAGLIALYKGGFNIRTTIDVNLETYVENAINRHLNQPEYQPFPYGHYATLSQDNNVHNSAAVVMNAKTGEILAMDGSSDYNAVNDKTIDGQFNSATDAYRSPGSTWKPIIYATAFEMGMYPSMVLPDVKTYFPNNGATNISGAYVPNDYGNVYVGGNNTIRVATADSRNVPAIKALQFAGIDNVANTARRFGITALDQDIALVNKEKGTHYKSVSDYNQLSFAIGSMGVPLIQMTGAYQVFADQGQHVPEHSILDIWDNYGHHLYHYDPTHPDAVQVISPQVAFLMTSVLSDEASRAAEFGDDHVLSFYDWDPTDTIHQVAAKTGTTDNFTDNWTMGYTPNVVVGVWSGNSDNSPLSAGSVGVTGAAPIWHSIIERVSGMPCDQNSANWDGVTCGSFNAAPYNFNQGTFSVPSGVHQASTSSANGLEGSGSYDWMLDGEDPTAYGIGSSVSGLPGGTGTGGTGNGGGGSGGGGKGSGGGSGGGGGKHGGQPVRG